MSAGARASTREEALEELRLGLHEMLAAHRRLRGRDGRHPRTICFAHDRLLSALRREGELTSSQLAAAADLAAASTTEMVDVLVEAGFVERSRDDADRRVVRVRLTPLGHRRYDARRAELVAAWNAQLADLETDGLRNATAVLGRLSSFFDGL